jgi:hypothetical protein
MRICRRTFLLGLLLSILFPHLELRGMTIAREGKARAVIVIDPHATPAESFAANELASYLRQITGASFKVRKSSRAPENAIIVGSGTAARKWFPDVPFDQLGDEECVARSSGGRLLLTGGRPRGTLYAVSRFLQEQCGVRWWTPWARTVPDRESLEIGDLNMREAPAFEYREPYWFTSRNADWARRNECNGNSTPIPENMGGHVIYKGFVHTFYPLVPPDQYFAIHPEWFSLINGKRATNGAQLCLTNPRLREFMLARVKESLRQSPEARIISVSQNDCFGACQCDACRALDTAEGSHSGTMLDFVNYIADNIRTEFPNTAVDTLAYQYTRKPPLTLRSRPNVIVRLCSIECNFGSPMDDPSNASFANDIRGWAERSDRLYIWDYVTDFANYVQPHPNWFVLGPNLRYFLEHHVRGVFEEGAYQSYGSEMQEMRAWVLAQLLWNPHQDDRALIREFLNGYYGPAAGPVIWRYMELLDNAARHYNLTCNSPASAPFLRFDTLAQAETLWQEAERSVARDSELLARVRLGHLPVLSVWLMRWNQLRKECETEQGKWPVAETRGEVASKWRAIAAGIPGKPWTQVTIVNEGKLSPEKFLAKFK